MEQRTGEQATAAEEAQDVLATIERVKRNREARAMSVPCGLTDAAECNDGHRFGDADPIGDDDGQSRAWCPLRNDDDCPAKIQRETDAAAAAKASRSARAPLERAIAMGLLKRQREELGLEPGTPALQLALNDALRATRGPGYCILVLCGPTGTGKSFAAAEWLWARGGLWRTAGELARMPWYGKDSEVGRLESAAALVIDDLGVQADAGAAGAVFRSRLGELVAARFAAKLPTLITTNATGDDLRRILDDRIKDRMRQDGIAVECVGESLRRAPVQEKLAGCE
jgi:hypothetical protein